MILETIFSTLSDSGEPNFAPMGIECGQGTIVVRPYRSSRTYGNLLRNGYGVANFSDNVLAFVSCGLYDEVLPGFPAKVIRGVVFQDACSWLELEVVSEGGSEERAEFLCRVLHKDTLRDFMGFCRAKSMVIEAAILATRLRFHGLNSVLELLGNYSDIVEKTGSEADKEAFRRVLTYVQGERQA